MCGIETTSEVPISRVYFVRYYLDHLYRNGPLAADIARINDARHIIRRLHIDIAEIDKYQVAVCTTDDKSKVTVDILSV